MAGGPSHWIYHNGIDIGDHHPLVQHEEHVEEIQQNGIDIGDDHPLLQHEEQVEEIHQNGIDIDDNQPLLQHVEEEQQQEGEPVIPANYLNVNILEINDMVLIEHANENQIELPGDQESVASSSETLQNDNNEIFDNAVSHSIPFHLQNGYIGQSSDSSDPTDSSSPTLIAGEYEVPALLEPLDVDPIYEVPAVLEPLDEDPQYESPAVPYHFDVDPQYEVPAASYLFNMDPQFEAPAVPYNFDVDPQYQLQVLPPNDTDPLLPNQDDKAEGSAESEVSNLSASGQASSEVHAPVERPEPRGPEQPIENPEPSNLDQQEVAQTSSAPASPSRAKLYWKYGSLMALFISGATVVTVLEITGYVTKDFLIIALLFFFMMLLVTVVLFIAACQFKDDADADDASVNSNTSVA